jgi:hypothetical protein
MLGIEVLVRCTSLLNAGWVPEPELGSNRCGRALAASEAGRTARADADPNFVALVRWDVRLVAWIGYAFSVWPLKARSTFMGARLCILAMPNV